MKKNNKKAFSIIEILVWMVIFLVWVSWIYSIIDSTLKLNESNKNYIIWVNLAREQLELFRNIRDTNFSKQRGYINTTPKDCVFDTTNEDEKCERFEVWKTYKISNNFRTTWNFTVEIKKVTNSVSKPYNFTDLEDFKVCIFEKDDNWNKIVLYDYCNTTDTSLSKIKDLKMYKFIEVSKVENFEIAWLNLNDTNKEKAIKVTSKVIWYSKRFQEFEVTSIFTDYKY